MLRGIYERLRFAAQRDLSLGNLADRLAEVYGVSPAYLLPEPDPAWPGAGEAVSYRQLAERVGRLCGGLDALGVRVGDRVAVHASGDRDTMACYLAVMRRGAVLVPLNPLLAADEVRHALDDAGCRALILDAESLRRTFEGTPPAVELVALAGPIAASQPRLPSLEALAVGAPVPPPARPDPDEVVAIFYTSGTTGRSKGAALTSGGILSNLRAVAPFVTAVSPRREVGLGALPLAHIMGFLVAVVALGAGLPVVHFARFDARRVLEAIERWRVSIFVGVPAMYRLLEEAGAAGRDLKSVRVWASGSDLMPADLMARFKSYGALVRPFGRPVGEAAFCDVYGSVEIGGGALVRLSLPGVPPRDGFVGFPLYPLRARIVDDDGAEVRRGEVGRLAVSGPGVFTGYVGDREAPGPGEWLVTGDLASRDRWGSIRFVGREKDVIKHGGYSVFAAEVEQILLGHPAIARAAVFGVPDAVKGEIPVAAVTLVARSPHPVAEADLVAWIHERVAAYKRPRRIVILEPGELPEGVTRKVLKGRLRDRFRGLGAPSS